MRLTGSLIEMPARRQVEQVPIISTICAECAFMNLEKVRPQAGHGSRMKSITYLNTVEMKGRSELARGTAAELGGRSEGNGDSV